MEKHCVLISGATIVNDDGLVAELQKSVIVLRNSCNSLVKSIIKGTKVDLILFEISKDSNAEVEIIENVKIQCPNIKIILINGNGNREVISKSFSYGANDAFRMPYKRYLVVERVKAILNKLQS